MVMEPEVKYQKFGFLYCKSFLDTLILGDALSIFMSNKP